MVGRQSDGYACCERKPAVPNALRFSALRNKGGGGGASSAHLLVAKAIARDLFKYIAFGKVYRSENAL